jgi:plasmid stability protein
MARFAKVSPEEIEKLLGDKHAKNTKSVLDNARKILSEFCGTEANRSLEDLSNEKLNDLLLTFKKNSFLYGIKTNLKHSIVKRNLQGNAGQIGQGWIGQY